VGGGIFKFVRHLTDAGRFATAQRKRCSKNKSAETSTPRKC